MTWCFALEVSFAHEPPASSFFRPQVDSSICSQRSSSSASLICARSFHIWSVRFWYSRKSSRMIRPRNCDCGFLKRKKGKPFVQTRRGTRRRPETLGKGRSKIEGVFGCGHTIGPRLLWSVALGSKFKANAPEQSDDALMIGIVAKSKT
jgi:hypothetical protein